MLIPCTHGQPLNAHALRNPYVKSHLQQSSLPGPPPARCGSDGVAGG